MKKAFTIFLFVLTIIFLVLSPSFIISGVHNTRMQSGEKSENYTGILTLWYIADDIPSRSYLNGRISAFEKLNTNVFIESQTLSSKEAISKLSAGENPDIISFPLGFNLRAEQVCELADIRTAQAFNFCGKYNGNTFAYPYLADFYVLGINQNIFLERDIEYPIDYEISKELFYYTLQNMSFSRSTGENVSPLSVKTAIPLLYLSLQSDSTFTEQVSEKSFNEYSIDYCGGTDSFKAEKSATTICPYSEYKNIAKSTASMNLNSVFLTEYTDLIRMISVFPNENEKKLNMAKQFAEYILSETSQAKVSEYGFLPVMPSENIFDDDPFMHTAFYEKPILYAPNTFLYFENSSEISAAVQGALIGNMDAKSDFEKLAGVK